MRKIALISIIFILFISVSFVSADDSLDNATLATPAADEVSESVLAYEESDVLQSSSEISVDDSNYDDYFNPITGKFKESVDVSGLNTLKIGNVSEKLFTIDRPLNIMPISSDCQMSNGVIHLIQGSDGSNVTNMIINNTKGDIYKDGLFVCKLHGIWFSNSSHNCIYNNTICIAEAEGCYAMPMGYSSYNRILYNDMKTGYTSTMVMGSCHYNDISYNRIEVGRYQGGFVAANAIYFNPYGHADYLGPGDCIGNNITNNYIRSNSHSIWAWTLAIEGQSNNTLIINNTIIGGSYGIIVDSGDDKHLISNCLIKGNTVINSTVSIASVANSLLVCDNYITGSSMSGGISVDGKYNITVRDNVVDYDNLNAGISVGSNVHAYANKVKLSNYGVGLTCNGNNSVISRNIINVVADNGMGIYGNNNIVTNNFISTKDRGIVLTASKILKNYNNSITNNRIESESYAVYISGYVYNTLISDNLVQTNSSEAFYIKIEETFTDRNPGKILDNTVNGVIEGTDTIIIDDNNFYDYFDEDGYLTYEFNMTQKRMLFLTFLSNKDIHFTDQIVLTSNKQPNLLYNVSITFSADACDSSISDFKFYNFDNPSVILDGVENVDVKNNEFTTIASDIFDVNVISVVGGCYDSNIVGNDIFITSLANYTYGIFISEPESKLIKRFSSNFKISNNNIFVKSTGVGEGIYIDSLRNSTISSNDISLICDDSAYGIALANVFGSPQDIKIDSNEIVLNSKQMSYLIELYMCDSIDIVNNYLKGTSNGIYGVGVYRSHASINNNEIVVLGKNLTDERVFDSLGKGNAAIYVHRNSQIDSLSKNVIDVNNCEVLTNDSSLVNRFRANNYVIADYNYDYYFDSANSIKGDIFGSSDVILFKNITCFRTMDIDVPVLIKPYKHLNQFTSYLILSGNYSDLNLSGFVFKNATLKLDNVSGAGIVDNSFVSSEILVNSGVNNSILNNSFSDSSEIYFNSSTNAAFAFNNVTSIVIVVDNANDTTLFGNYFNVTGESFNLISSISSFYNNISNNVIIVNAAGDSHVYWSVNTTHESFLNNNIQFDGDYADAVIYYDELSSNNDVMFNKIISSSVGGEDYAVVSNAFNIISNNYLISSNGFRRGNDAVNASMGIVRDNTPSDIYVSSNVSVSGNGSIESPYSTIGEALQNALSGSIIYILPGYYRENNLIIDKNITLTAINLEGITYLDALGERLFKITKDGELTVNALKIFNGFSIEGGGLFYNQGILLINNSMIYNSSSYYDNSNPVFTKDKYVKNSFNSYDCENLGLGGAVLNYGDLIIESSNLFDNYAHKGGAIADFGKSIIRNSLIFDNTAVHGGAVYTDSKKGFLIDNTYFMNNLAVTTLDHCYIKKVQYNDVNVLNAVPKYRYSSQCDMGCGYGGAIFSNSDLTVLNSLFEGNTARTGGAISTPSTMENYYSYHDVSYSSYGTHPKFAEVTLTVYNSTFSGNIAKDTRGGNATMLISPDNFFDYFNRFFMGGAIFGSSKELNIRDCLFEGNIANTDGGALCVQSENSTVEGCKFYNNTAGAYGGALSVFGNSEVFNTEIVSNYARDGGALHYASYTNYNHIQNNMNMFNVTVADNVALGYGGAFVLENTNFAIRNSNIYGNKAPNGETFGTKYGHGDGSKIDARSNWWGDSKGPDDSVRKSNDVRYRTWLSDRVDWAPVKISPSNNDDNKGNGERNNGANTYSPSTSSTGSGVRTGSTLNPDSNYGGNSHGFSFPGKWPSSGSGNGGGNGFSIDGIRFGGNSSSNSKTPVHGNAVNPNSMSKVNSSSVNDLSSIGMTSNAADSSSSSASSASDEGSSGSNHAYEITKDVKKEIIQHNDSSIFNILFILSWIFLFIGFYRKYRSENN